MHAASQQATPLAKVKGVACPFSNLQSLELQSGVLHHSQSFNCAFKTRPTVSLHNYDASLRAFVHYAGPVLSADQVKFHLR